MTLSEREDLRPVQIIIDGGDPRQVALKFPRYFVRFHAGIICLWEQIHRRDWRVNE